MKDLPDTVGPVLFSNGAEGSRHHMRAVLARRGGGAPPVVGPIGAPGAAPVCLYDRFGWRVWAWDFTLEGRDAVYRCDDEHFTVCADLGDDVRIAYVSCNGQEDGDLDRTEDERNPLWQAMVDAHRAAPYGLVLHGGDQLYADEILESHPEIARWRALDIDEKPSVAFTDDMEAAAERFLLELYLRIYSMPSIHYIGAHVPSLMMWDDHDIFDGWGSHPATYLNSAVARGVYAVAERMFRVFQLGDIPDSPLEQGGFGFVRHYPGFSIVAPDLRTSRRPHRVMDDASWAQLERAMASVPRGDHVFVMSSVPALGPRLSWVEALMGILPGIQKYEDDLRDQWQSRAHREEWRRFLSLLEDHMVEEGPVTIVSGEIHLATRAEMQLRDGATMHQLVASGIAHSPPPALYARALGGLSWFGENPLPGRPIVMRRLPGQRHRYVEQRNYMSLLRQGGEWSAVWSLEGQPPTAPLFLRADACVNPG